MRNKDLPESEKAKNIALNFLSVRPRSQAEIVKKLRLKRIAPAVIEETVQLLTRQGLLDDAKFASLYANSLVYSRPSGARKLAFDLKQKGLSESIIQQALSGLSDHDEKKMVHDLISKRISSMAGLSREARNRRLFGFLQRRGFSSELIFEALKIHDES